MSSRSPSLGTTSLEAHLQIHLSRSKLKVKNTSRLRPCYSTEAEATLGSTLFDGWAMDLSMMSGLMSRSWLMELSSY